MGGPGAAVIGIGDAGDITPGALTAGIAQAVMRLVAARPDESHSNPDDRYLDVASVLIGTTSLGGLNVASAVHAAITGVRRANRRILDLGLDTQVRRLRVYELYEDRANEALQAALRIRSDSDAAEANGLAITDLLEEGVDGLPGSPPTTYSADRWRTIRVSTPKVATGAGSDQMDLFFNEIGRTAGAETLLSQGQRKIIDELIEGCVRTPYVDEQTYNTLYELVVPRPMKGQGRPSEHDVPPRRQRREAPVRDVRDPVVRRPADPDVDRGGHHPPRSRRAARDLHPPVLRLAGAGDRRPRRRGELRPAARRPPGGRGGGGPARG